MPKDEQFVILGAGLAGLSAAYFLKDNYQLFEKEAQPGGLCRSRHINGYIFDYDGHLFHFRNKSALDLVRRLTADNLTAIKRNSWIGSFGEFTRYPFQANLYGLPKQVVKECIFGFIDAQLHRAFERSNHCNFKQWVVRTFGPGMAKHFMLPYNNKFWTVPAQTLTSEWVDGYIPVPSIKDVLSGTIAQSKKRFGYNARFWYPRRGGVEAVTLAFQKQLKNGIHTQHEATVINLQDRTVSFQNGKRLNFDNLISTVPLIEMGKLIPHLPVAIKAAFAKLRYNSIFCLNLGISREQISDKHWIYFPEKKFIFFRVGFPSNFSNSVTPQGKSSLYVEVSHPAKDLPNKERLTQRILEDLHRADILKDADLIDVCDPLYIKYAYIIYDRHYKESTRIIQEYLNQHHVYLLGRYGRWKYMSMEDVILDGKNIASKIKGE
ncbi:MAG: FAD-dependent oxidoreductase [Candidatus Omnitrophota bacterium]